MAITEELVARIDANTIEMQKELARATSKFDKFENNLTKKSVKIGAVFGIAAIAAAKLAQSIGRLASSTVGTITRFEKLESSLKTITGSAEGADAAFSFISEFATTTPFDLEQVTTAFIKLKALGLTPSEEALKSYGNTASAMGKSLNQMIEAVADAATGEFERLKEFGIITRSQGDKVSFIFQGVTTTVKKNAKEIEGYLKSIGQVQFAGAMEDQASTLDVSLSNLGVSFSLLQKAIGEAGLGDAIKSVTDKLKVFIESVTNFIENIDIFINKLGVVKDRITDIGIVSDAIDIASSAANKLGSAYDYIRNKVIGAGSAIRDNFMESDVGERITSFTDKIKEDFKVIDERAAKAAESAKLLAEQKLKDVIGNGAGEDTKGLKDSTFGGGMEDLDKELQDMQDFFKTREEIELDYHSRRLEAIREAQSEEYDLTEEQKNKLKNLEALHEKAKEEIQKKADEDRLRRDKANFKALISSAASNNKLFFQLNKARALAEGVLKMREAIMGAYNVGASIGGPALGAAFGAAAGAAQATNLAAIASASYGGGGVGGGSSGGGGNPIATREVNDFGQPVSQSVSTGREVNVTVVGTAFSPENIRELVEAINEQSGDNVRIITQ